MKKIILLIAFCMAGYCINAQTTYNLDWYMGISMDEASIEIEVGDTVIWTFTDSPPHSVTSDVGSTETFDSGILPSGSTFSYTFTTVGTNPYHCEVHPSMTGVITVSAGGPQINTVEVTGYNEDIVANGTGPMASSTTMAADADSFCLMSEDWILNAGDTPISVGLPANGQIVSPDIAGLTYQIPTAAAPYEGNNSLRIDLAGGGTGEMTLVTPTSYSSLYFLVFAGNGDAFVDATVNFADATTETFAGNTVPDWFLTGLPVEIQGFGRGDRDNNNVETPFNNPKLFRLQLDISAPNQTKNISSVTFNLTNIAGDDVVFNVLAVNGKETTSCLPPYDIVVSNILTDSADISWSTTAGITEWEIEYGPVGFTLGTGTVVADTNGVPGETLVGLSAATEYEVYVTAICGSGSESEPVGPIAFDTGCGTVATGFTEGFESTDVGEVTNCWSIINQGGPDAWAVSDIGTDAYDGSKVMYISWDANPAHDDYLITPQIAVIAGSTDRFRFQAWGNSTFYQETFNVLVSTTGTDVADFTLIDGPTLAPQTDWAEYEYNLSAYAGQNIYIAIQIISNDQLQLYIDGVVLDALPACPEPIDLSADVTTNSAELAWTETGSATSWDIEWGLAGFAPTGTPTNPGVSNPYTINTLSPGLTYEFYVRGVCGGSEVSDWAGPYEFTTDCDLVTTGFTQGFESTDVGEVTNCWSIINQGGPDAWAVSDVGVNAYDGTKVMYIEWDFNPAHDDYLITPQISVISGTTDRFTFYSSSSSTFYNETFNVLVSTTGTEVDDFILIDGPITSPQVGYAEHLYNLSDYAGQNIYIAIQVISDNQLHLYIDGVVLDALPSCPKPNDLAVDNITTDSADLSWNETGSATMWDIEYGIAGFAPTGVPTNEDVTNPYPLNGLASGTEYEYYVRSDCGGGDTSVWVGPFAFQTNFTCGDTFFDAGGTGANYNDNAVRTWTISADTPGYIVTATFTSFDVESNYDALYVHNGPDDTYPLIASFNPMTNSGFPAGGYYGGDLPGPFTSTDPSGALTFVFMSDGSGTLAGWSANITCGPPPTCPTPSELTAVPTTNSVELGWTENGSSAAWDIELGFEDFDPTGMPTNTADANPFTVDGLQPGAIYEFYVRANCGGGDVSEWAGPFEFTMLCETVYVPDYLEAFTFFPNCWQEADEGLVEDGPLNIGTGPWFADEFLNTGENISASIYIYTDNQVGWLISPNIDLSGGNYELAYTAAITDYFNSNPPEGAGMGSDDAIQVLITADAGASWEILKTYDQTDFPSATGDAEIIQLGGYDTTVQIAFWATGGSVDDPEAYDVFIDDFEVRESTITCAEPVNLIVSAITGEEATLSWEEVGNADAYTWYVFEAGADPETATPIATGTTSSGVLTVVVMGLTPETDYDFYVVADCGATDGLSEMAGPVPFQTNELGIEDQLFAGFNYYPNPVNSKLTLESPEQISEVVLYNLLGQKVLQIQPNTMNPVLELDNLQSGAYLMKITIAHISEIFTIVKE